MFQINHLDHVAINVRDMDVSIAWYERVLGLRKTQLPAWGTVPTFMLAGTTGVAIFPAQEGYPDVGPDHKGVKIEHFAFNVSNEDFAKARAHYDELGITYRTADHTYFHSIYTLDPDGHEVELTTLVVDAEEVFGAD